MATDEQRRAMLVAIHEREGRWGSIDAEKELISIGQDLGLDEDQSLDLFKQLVDEHYIDPGWVLQVPGSKERGGQFVGFDKINVTVGGGMKIIGPGRAEIGI